MKATIKQIIKKYRLDDKHKIWEHQIDNWMSVEVARVVLGRLPEKGDSARELAMEFLDNEEKYLGNKNFGSMYLTAGRMIYNSIKTL